MANSEASIVDQGQWPRSNLHVVLGPSGDVTDVAQATDDYRSEREPSSAASVSSVASASSVTSYDPLDIQRFIPWNPMAWRSALFKLARHSHGRNDADERFAEWKRCVTTALNEEELDEEWLFAKSAVKYPPRIRLLEILARAQDVGIPEWIRQIVPKSGRLQLTLTFLLELQNAAFPAENFFISTRDLGKLFGASAQWGSRTLQLFVKLGVLELVASGRPQNWKASRFRFIRTGPLE